MMKMKQVDMFPLIRGKPSRRDRARAPAAMQNPNGGSHILYGIERLLIRGWPRPRGETRAGEKKKASISDPIFSTGPHQTVCMMALRGDC